MMLYLMLTWALAGAVSPAPAVEIPGPEVVASDFAEAAPQWAHSDAVLARSPLPGITRRVSRTQLERWAHSAGLPADGLPESIFIRRKLRPLSEDEARRRLAAAIADALKKPLESVEIELQDYAAELVPAGELNYHVSGAATRLNRPTKFFLRWREPGGPSGAAVLLAVVRIRSPYLQARSDLRAGDPARAADFLVVDGYLPDGRFKFVTSLDQLEGKKLSRPIREGEPLRADLLVSRPDVERGDIVELILNRGAVRLRTSGRAESAGSVGRIVAFRSLAGGTRVLARISSEGVAEVIRR